LRRYSDKTVARDHVRELESFGGDPANLVHSGMAIRCVESFNTNKDIMQEHFRGHQIPILLAQKSKLRDPFIAPPTSHITFEAI
jgi:hypothetical protein